MRKIRVLLFKPGIDGHWRGILTVSHALSQAGMEVVFEGFKAVDDIVESALQEDVDVIGFSVHSGAHLEWTSRINCALEESGIREGLLLLVGGAIPHADHPLLKERGADAVFSPGADTRDMVKFITESLPDRD